MSDSELALREHQNVTLLCFCSISWCINWRMNCSKHLSVWFSAVVRHCIRHTFVNSNPFSHSHLKCHLTYWCNSWATQVDLKLWTFWRWMGHFVSFEAETLTWPSAGVDVDLLHIPAFLLHTVHALAVAQLLLLWLMTNGSGLLCSLALLIYLSRWRFQFLLKVLLYRSIQ